MMSLPVLIIISVIGMLCILLEFFIPGGIIGGFGTLLVIGSTVTAFVLFDQQTGIIFLIGSVVIVIPIIFLGYYLMQNTKLGNWMILEKPDKKAGKGENNQTVELTVGQIGMTISDLRPSGVARFDGKRYDVVTEGEFIEKNQEIKILNVEGNRTVVIKNN